MPEPERIGKWLDAKNLTLSTALHHRSEPYISLTQSGCRRHFLSAYFATRGWTDLSTNDHPLAESAKIMANMVPDQSLADRLVMYHFINDNQCLAANAASTKPTELIVVGISTHLQLVFMSSAHSTSLAALGKESRMEKIVPLAHTHAYFTPTFSSCYDKAPFFVEIDDVQSKWRPGLSKTGTRLSRQSAENVSVGLWSLRT
jgi:hypothetical protein